MNTFETYTCPNCHTRYDSEDVLVPRDENPKVGCLQCMEGWDRNGVTLYVGMVDYGQRDKNGEPVRRHVTNELSIEQLARMDDKDFWEHVTNEMAASLIADYRDTEAQE